MTSTDVFADVHLSSREIQILDGLAHGLTAGKIGESLRLTENTVRTYITQMRLKLSANNVAHLVALGFVHGYLQVREQVTV